MTNVQIYVGTYSKYNNGSIYGAWMNLNDFSSIEELYQAMKELHKDEDDPEFMFQDFECSEVLSSLNLISEYHISENIFEIIEALETSDYSEEVIEAYLTCFNSTSSDINEVLEKIADYYIGEYNNDIDFTEEFLDGAGEISNHIPNLVYIDWERTARDFMMDYTCDNNHYFRLY